MSVNTSLERLVTIASEIRKVHIPVFLQSSCNCECGWEVGQDEFATHAQHQEARVIIVLLTVISDALEDQSEPYSEFVADWLRSLRIPQANEARS